LTFRNYHGLARSGPRPNGFVAVIVPAKGRIIKVKTDMFRSATPEAREKAPVVDQQIERTVLAAERTLMAWIRTAISLITFGFSLYKILQYAMELESKAGGTAVRSQSPRNVGLLLIGLAMVILVIADVGHHQYMIRIGAPPRRAFSIPFFVIVFLFIVASVLFVSVLVHSKLL
jgi:putative membrane protein